VISIRRRLLTFLLPALLVSLGLAAALSYTEAKYELDVAFDYHLREVAESLGQHSVLSLAVDRFDEHNRETDILLQVWDRARNKVLGPHLEELPLFLETGFRNVSVGGRELRIYSLVTASRVIQVAQPVEVRRNLGAEIAANSVLPVALALPLVVLIVWLAVGRGLEPLNRLASEVAARTPESLDPLPNTSLPAEVRPLVEGLNGLLGRLARALEGQRAFIADAAHELRSPMTALRLQLELVEKAENEAGRVEALASLKAGLERGIHMVEQLMALARLDPEAPLVRSEVDLLMIAREAVVAESVFAENKNIDLGLAASTSVAVNGDQVSLGTMLHNLIDNAVRYTPSGGRVDVAVRREATQAVVEVLDSGPGIPEAQRERVFYRFYRGAQASGAGSGLGLAIAKRVVERHGGSIALGSGEGGCGLRVSVRLTNVAFRNIA
jgi:two-component system OmpR family sensor kinase